MGIEKRKWKGKVMADFGEDEHYQEERERVEKREI